MKIIDPFYSVVAAIVAVILYAQSVAGDGSSKSKAGKGEAVGAAARWLRNSVLATKLVDDVFNLAEIPLINGIERGLFESNVLGSSFFDDSAVWDIDIFSLVDTNADEFINVEELTLHVLNQPSFIGSWVLGGKEGSKSGKRGNADPEAQFWLGMVGYGLVDRIIADAGISVGQTIPRAVFPSIVGRYGITEIEAISWFEDICAISNSNGDEIGHEDLKTHVETYLGGETSVYGEQWIAVHGAVISLQFYSFAGVGFGVPLTVDSFRGAVANLQPRVTFGLGSTPLEVITVFTDADSDMDNVLNPTELSEVFVW